MNILIIKYNESFCLNLDTLKERWPKWGLVTIDTSKKRKKLVFKDITRKEALSAIRENKLELVHEDRNGRIYDTTDRAFKKLYDELNLTLPSI